MRLTTTTAVLIFLAGSRLAAASSPWPAGGIPICTAPGDQEQAVIASDGTGGWYVAWMDRRTPAQSWDIYAQRITSDGTVAAGWPPNGVILSGRIGAQLSPQIAADGEGGAIVVWMDDMLGTHTRLHAIRVTAAGTIASGWALDGNPIADASRHQLNPYVMGDGTGGAYVVWDDIGSLGQQRGRATRITAGGTIAPGWPSEGLQVSPSAVSLAPRLVSDGAGGMLIAWEDHHSTIDIYAQRILPDGTTALGWPSGGVALTTAADHQFQPRIVGDANGGAFVAWTGSLPVFPPDQDGYVGHLLGGGVADPAWPSDGLLVADQPSVQSIAQVVQSNDGVIVAWVDQRSGGSAEDWDVYAARVQGSGMVDPGWMEGGAPICLAPGYQDGVQLCPDQAGGAWIAWVDFRVDSIPRTYVTHVDAGGTVAPGFPVDGLPITPSAIEQYLDGLAPDGAGGAVLVWSERRITGDARDIFASRFGHDHPVQVPNLMTRDLALRMGPNPTDHRITLSFASPHPEPGRLELFDVMGRSLHVLEVQPGDATALGGSLPLAPGIYLIRITQRDRSITARAVVLQ